MLFFLKINNYLDDYIKKTTKNQLKKRNIYNYFYFLFYYNFIKKSL
jgi:hypothetical protein